MRSYPVNSAITITVPFIDANGDPVAPTGASAVVTNELDEVVATIASIPFSPGDTSADLVLSAGINATPGLRTIVVTVATASGSFAASLERYVLLAAVPLVLLQNSFQTYSQALYEASQMMPNLAWDNASEIERITGLSTAFDMLTRFGYRIYNTNDPDDQSRLFGHTYVIPAAYWASMTVDRWNEYPEHFRRAIRRAQIAQAAEMVNGDIVAKKRRQGLLSETIGESSMMFRSGKPLDIGMSKDVLSYIARYIDYRVTITRS